MSPGQFVEVRVDNSPTTFLRRPISINFVDKQNNELWLLVAAIGEGTRHLAQLRSKETLNCLLPLGNGFSMPSSQEECLLIGGGVGVAPLLYLAQEIKNMGGNPTMLLGARNKNDLVELDCFRKYGNVLITTEDSSEGEKGFVTNHSILTKKRFDKIYSCGPKPMMVAVARYANKANIDCEVSLENLMACGLGACLCCVEKTIEGNLCVCKEGPVFNINKLLWQI
jgi:dihydroorotate dehydrogenase electron transfer subunit